MQARWRSVRLHSYKYEKCVKTPNLQAKKNRPYPHRKSLARTSGVDMVVHGQNSISRRHSVRYVPWFQELWPWKPTHSSRLTSHSSVSLGTEIGLSWLDTSPDAFVSLAKPSWDISICAFTTPVTLEAKLIRMPFECELLTSSRGKARMPSERPECTSNWLEFIWNVLPCTP